LILDSLIESPKKEMQISQTNHLANPPTTHQPPTPTKPHPRRRIHTIVGAGKGEGAMDAGNLLKPMLARGELRCIGATTLDEYRTYIEKDPALERRFQQVFVDQPSVEDTVSILRGLRERYELHHGVRITDSALVEAAALSDRYITERFLPDKVRGWLVLGEDSALRRLYW
jgi:hypothetical protein